MKQKVLYTLLVTLFATMQAYAQTKTTYEYDELNRLAQVTYSNGVTVVYTYDALGNRLSKKVTGGVDFIKGDANGDKAVDVMDVVTTVDYILNKSPEPFLFVAADVNGDNDVDVTDVVGIVDIILGRASARRRASEPVRTDNDRLQLTRPVDDRFTLDLSNEDKYVAAQFDVRLSEDQQLEGITPNRSRLGRHSLTYSLVAENTYRLLIYSLGNDVMRGNDGELLTIRIAGAEGSFIIDNISFVTSAGEKKLFGPLSCQTTGITTITTLPEPTDVYSLDGRLIKKSATSLNGLPNGVYIINGSKVVK